MSSHLLEGLNDTQGFAQKLASFLKAGDLLILSGELGAGKTSFTRALGNALHVREGVISPTFVLVREHPSLIDGPSLVHADVYRLPEDSDIDDLDLESRMDTAVTVVEWGEGRVEYLSDSALILRFQRSQGAPVSIETSAEELESEPRTLEIETRGPRWAGIDFNAMF